MSAEMKSYGFGLLHFLAKNCVPISVLEQQGIREEDFDDAERLVYQIEWEHFIQYGSMPQVTTVEAECGIKFMQFPDEPLSYWALGVIRRREYKSMHSGLLEALDLAKREDLEGSKEIIARLYRSLSPIQDGFRACEMPAAFEGVGKAYHMRKLEDSVGIPFGIDFLDAVSGGGAMPGDTMALVARPGVGKSLLLTKMALTAMDRGFSILMVSLEMDEVQVGQRFLAMKAGVSTTRLRDGQLSSIDLILGDGSRIPSAESRLEQCLSNLLGLESVRKSYLLVGTTFGRVEHLIAKVQEYKPQILYIDGAYMLRSKTRRNARWEDVSEAAEMVKKIAMEFGIPIVGAYQLNRRGESSRQGGVGAIAYSDSIGQLASTVLEMRNEKVQLCGRDPDDWDDAEIEGSGFVVDDGDVWNARPEYKHVRIVKGRSGEEGAVRLVYDKRKTLVAQDSVLSGGNIRLGGSGGQANSH